MEPDHRTAEGEEAGTGAWGGQGEPGGQRIWAAESPGTEAIRAPCLRRSSAPVKKEREIWHAEEAVDGRKK